MANNEETPTIPATRDAALSFLRADYYEDVSGYADDIEREARERAKAGETDLREWLLEYIHETVDGCQRVIYTGLAIETLLFSSNDSAYADDFGTEGMVKDGAVNYSALAYCAVERDVIEELERRGLDVNADDLGIEVEEEADEESDDEESDDDGDEA